MELKVVYQDRKVKFYSGKNTGEELDKLIKFVGKNSVKLEIIRIHGKSNSYTFMRQIYLFANLIAFLADIPVFINGTKFDSDSIRVPDYKKFLV